MDSKELRNISNKILDKITSENIKDSDKVEIIMDILDVLLGVSVGLVGI